MKRRFIAGVVCPKCEQMDKIQMYDDDNHQRWRECVSCGFKELLIDQPSDTAEELKTRVNKPVAGEKPLAHEEEVQIINLMDHKTL
ncbi:MAG: YheV family putative metal-binding protein, partial [Hyphomicrobiales bacterium]|nr:YheV family putative metal-binding protein [Hyphomicrobiales bacterium]